VPATLKIGQRINTGIRITAPLVTEETTKAMGLPPNLSAVSAANGGTFPFERIAEASDGRRDVVAHGTRDMPVWGRAVRFGPSIVRARVRVIDYVSTLQGK
jgi:hypothetical protein